MPAGIRGEECLPCPQGAACEGDTKPPAVLPGCPPAFAVPGDRLQAMLDELPPGERRARDKSVRAAAKYVPLLSMAQAAEILGCSLAEIRSLPPERVAEDLVIVFGFGWTAGTIDNGRLEWQRLAAFAGAAAGWTPGQRISGYVFRSYMDTRALQARAAYRRRVAGGIVRPRPGNAAGGSVKQAVVRGARFNAVNGRFRIDLSSVAVDREAKRARRRPARVQPSLSLKMVAGLAWHAELGDKETTAKKGGLDTFDAEAARPPQVPPTVLKKGTRISVFWTEMNEWFDATVTSSRLEIGDDGQEQRATHVTYDAVGPWTKGRDLKYWHCLDDVEWELVETDGTPPHSGS